MINDLESINYFLVKLAICLIACFCLAVVVYSQNARLSQIASAPVQFNPALSGRFDGKMRAGFISSWQKSETAFMPHQNLNFDFKFGQYKNLGDDIAYVKSDSERVIKTSTSRDEIANNNSGSQKIKGYWSGGFNIYHFGKDWTGVYDNSSPLNANFYSINLARHLSLGKNRYFGFGVQATYAQGKLDENNGTAYDREISGGGFRYSNKNAAGRTSKNDYFDYNVGAYYGMITEPLSFEIGLAMYHLFYPKNDIFIIDDETKQRHRMTLHSVLRFRLSDNYGIIQRNMYWAEGLYWKSTSFYDSAHIIALYTGFDIYKTNPKSTYNANFGFYSRSFRTIMPVVNLQLGKMLQMRFSYEFPINSDRYNAYTAERTEISILFTHKRNTQTGTRFYKKFNYW